MPGPRVRGLMRVPSCGISAAHTETCSSRSHRRIRSVVSGQTRIPCSRNYHAGRAHGFRSVGMMPSLSLALLVLVGVGTPAVLLALLGCGSILNRPFPERWTGPVAAGSMMMACAALSAALVVYGATAKGA